MDCPTILNLKLGAHDKRALRKIREVQNISSILKIFLITGVMNQIFVKNEAWEVAINIYSNDWILFTRAMTAVSPIARHTIQKIANFQRLRPGVTYKQSQFWKAVASGCMEK